MVALACACGFFLGGCDAKPTLKPLPEDAVILAFGDSLTYGTGAQTNESYPAVLQAMLNRKVINAGIPGEVSHRGLARLPRLLAAYRPDLLILCHGANDILRHKDLQRTKQNLQNMIDLARQQGVDILLIAVPHYSVTLSPHYLYDELATENHLPILRSAISDILLINTLKSDFIHPNNKGYQTLENSIYSKLLEVGALPEPP